MNVTVTPIAAAVAAYVGLRVPKASIAGLIGLGVLRAAK